MDNPKVSVVVPIYNVERYLRECLDSIVNQTLKDIEIILINDGSVDNSKNIIDEYAKKDKRIVVIHQNNSGYGVTLNKGISLAKGEYIGIVESDDYIELTMYEKLYNNAQANNTDVTKSNFYIYNSKAPKQYQNIVFKQKHRDLTKAPKEVFAILEYPELLIFHSSIWSALYKADFIKNIKFIETELSSYQDFPFMIEVLCQAKRISVITEPLVHYRVEEDQNSSTVRKDSRLLIMPKQSVKAIDILKSHNLYNSLKEEIFYHIFIANWGFYNQIDKKYQKEYFYLLHNIFINLKDDKGFTYKYFDKSKRKLVNYFIKGKYKQFNLNFKEIRRFLLTFNFSKKLKLIQILGIQISYGDVGKIKRPALLKINISDFIK